MTGYNPENDVFASYDELQQLYKIGLDTLVEYGTCNLGGDGVKFYGISDAKEGIAVADQVILHEAELGVAALSRVDPKFVSLLGLNDSDTVTSLYRPARWSSDKSRSYLADIVFAMPERNHGGTTYRLGFYASSSQWYADRYDYAPGVKVIDKLDPAAMKRLETLALTELVQDWRDSCAREQRQRWTTE